MIENSNITIAVKTIRLQIGLSPEQQEDVFYELGLEWLQNYYKTNEERIARWRSSKLFWNWWRRKWEMETLDILRCWGFVAGEICDITEEDKSMYRKVYKSAYDSLYNIYPPYPLRQMIDSPRRSVFNY